MPKVWVIENPQTSKMWDFQNNHWNFKAIENLVFYSTYDKKFSLKPTIFKSNISLPFNRERIKGNNDHMAYGSYDQRSAIPEKLIEDMLVFILKSEKLKHV